MYQDCSDVETVTEMQHRSFFTWSMFAEYTTVHGIINITKTKSARQAVWVFTFVLSLCTCMWQCVDNFQEYFAFDVKSSTTWDLTKQVEYPAITLVSENLLNKKLVGVTAATRLLVAYIFKDRTTDLQQNIKRADKTCMCNTTDERLDYAKIFLDEMDMLSFEKKTFEEIMTEMEFLLVNRMLTFDRCWMNGKPVFCGKIVLTTLTDWGLGFTFNLHENLTNSLLNGSGSANLNRFYNQTTFKSNIRRGIRNELSLLVNANPDKYCGMSTEWFGTGFVAKFHHPKTFPMYRMPGMITYFRPGYHYRVFLKPTTFQRKTEHMGMCISRLDLDIIPTLHLYMRDVCYLQCIQEMVWTTCGCLPYPIPILRQPFAKKFGVNESEIISCVGPNRDCCMNIIERSENENIQLLCSKCQLPCEETVYDVEITATRFPSKYMEEMLANEIPFLDDTSDQLKNYYFMLSISFDSKMVKVVVETQKFTTTDLFIYVGGALGLFMGTSFVSCAEPVILVRVIFQSIKEFVERRKTQKQSLDVQKNMRKRKKARKRAAVIHV